MEKKETILGGKYILKHTLGQGSYSKVKLGVDIKTGKEYAIKIHKADDPKLNKYFIQVLETEVKTLLEFAESSEFVVKMVDYLHESTVEKANGKKYKVICVIVE